MSISARRVAAAAVLVAALAQPALATEHSVSAIRAIETAPHVASVQPNAPVVEASLMKDLIAFIHHVLGHDGGAPGTGDTIHRG